jgi:P4 family phage/plasmid primase-like protien
MNQPITTHPEGCDCGSVFCLWEQSRRAASPEPAPVPAEPKPKGNGTTRPTVTEEMPQPKPVLPVIGSQSEQTATPNLFTEDWLADQFARKYGASFRYVHGWGQWLRWTGEVWERENTLLAFDLARMICRATSGLPEATSSLKKWLSESSTVAGTIRFAQADRRHAATADQWDTDSWLLNTPDGMLDLKAGKLRAHDPFSYCSKITSCGPSSETPALWLAFLDRIFGGDQELISFVKRMCGYALTGDTSEHALFFLYGSGANGKGVFCKTLAGILHDYSREAALETFTETKSDQHPTGLAGLEGARLALVPETEKNSYWAESRLKQVTGGDRLTARRMRQDFFDFTPQFKLVISGNHKPRLRSVDEAIKRRMHLVPFAVTIPENERDPELFDKLKAEWPEILGWMLQGCLDWQRDGLNSPASVREATGDYLDAEDKHGLWLAERCIIGKRETCGSTDAYRDWRAWCEQTGEREGSQKDFSKELLRRGEIVENPSRRDGRGFIGFSLRGVPTND